MDIQSRKDIELLMTAFYEKVKNDDAIGFIFNDIARVNWDHHIPIICDFWETLLLDAASYKKNAMEVHYILNRKVPFQEIHFEQWLKFFFETVDQLFSGKIANMAKTKAKSIAALMQFKMKQETEGLNSFKNS
ncbi:group III truncated hemoglobin [Terrimonas pollutisoli]|uniref:group III truncated hemoglobin n=1 Tax=Terrimonas pollutisoli TaxID=3034147 RepID=UPI0023EE0A7D|nr:group III truncated hemoglobin [Terrimonas sp. H1YJ31]